MSEQMDFGEAIRALKAGYKVSRAGWNGKGMWLILVPGTRDITPREGTPYADALEFDDPLLGKKTIPTIEILSHIDMWTVNAEGRRAMLPGWLASQTDMLAEDWEIV